jgi:glycosyltransferase involved in cell wall biosynthesis
VWDLAVGLSKLDVTVHLFGTPRSQAPPSGFLHYVPREDWSSFTWGEIKPATIYRKLLLEEVDVLHDWTHMHWLADFRYWRGDGHAISTPWGNVILRPLVKRNLVCWSRYQRDLAVKQYRFPETTKYVWGGCVIGGTVIGTELGYMRIKDVVEKKVPLRVLGVDSWGRLRWVSISAYQELRVSEILRIETETGENIWITPDNLIFTQRGWIPAGKLVANDNIMILENRFLLPSNNSESDNNACKKGGILIQSRNTEEMDSRRRGDVKGRVFSDSSFEVGGKIEQKLALYLQKGATSRVKTWTRNPQELWNAMDRGRNRHFEAMLLDMPNERDSETYTSPLMGIHPRNGSESQLTWKTPNGRLPIFAETIENFGWRDRLFSGFNRRGWVDFSEQAFRQRTKTGSLATFNFGLQHRFEPSQLSTQKIRFRHGPPYASKTHPLQKRRKLCQSIRWIPMLPNLEGNLPLFDSEERACRVGNPFYRISTSENAERSIRRRGIKDLRDGQTDEYETEQKGTLFWSKVSKIERYTGNFKVYDLTTESGNFIANNILIHNCNVDFYCPDPDKPYEKDNYILWMSRAHPTKRPDIVYELARRFPNQRFVVAGSFSASPDHAYYGAYYKQAFEKLPNVKILPDVSHEEKRELYRRAKALLFPSVGECFGLVLVEALACGCPIIASRDGAFPELVVEGKTGFLCGSLEEYERALRNVEMLSPEECSRDAILRWSRERAAREYYEIYKKVANGEFF